MIQRLLQSFEVLWNLFLQLTICLGVFIVGLLATATIHAKNRPVNQALIITIPLSTGTSAEMKPLFKLEEELTKAIEHSRVGEYDGNEIGERTFTMFAYGPSADKLLEVALPILRELQLPKGSKAVKRYGSPGAREEVVALGTGMAN
jgi:hypothetical protein